MNTLLFIKKYWKLLLFLVGVLLITILSICTFSLLKSNRLLKNDYDRLLNNLENTYDSLETYTAKNGQLVYQLNSIIVDYKELKIINPKLVKEIENLRIRIKNLSSVNTIDVQYTTIIDSIPVLYEKPYYLINYSDNFMKLNTKLNTNSNSLEDTKLIVYDSLIISNEFVTKGWWFWKKVTGVKLKFSASNPNLKLTNAESYYIISVNRKKLSDILN